MSDTSRQQRRKMERERAERAEVIAGIVARATVDLLGQADRAAPGAPGRARFDTMRRSIDRGVARVDGMVEKIGSGDARTAAAKAAELELFASGFIQIAAAATAALTDAPYPVDMLRSAMFRAQITYED